MCAVCLTIFKYFLAAPAIVRDAGRPQRDHTNGECRDGSEEVGRFLNLGCLEVNSGVAARTDSNQVLFGVLARVTSKLLVVDLEVRYCAARLTPPAIATQDPLPQSLVLRSIQPQPNRVSASRTCHTDSLRPARNFCFCSPGSTWNSLIIAHSSICGSPFSRLAPAKKSAQIISKQ